MLSLKQRGGNFNGCVEMGSVVCSMPAHSGSPPAGARCSFHSLESHCIRVCHTCTSRVPCVLLLIPAAPHGHYFSSLSHQGSRGSPTPSPRATPRKNKIRGLRQHLSSHGYRQDPRAPRVTDRRRDRPCAAGCVRDDAPRVLAPFAPPSPALLAPAPTHTCYGSACV